MLKEFRCDLHVHTCLSPCADLEMYPRAIVEKSVNERLDVIAVCDHNSSENVIHVVRAASDKPLFVLPGMEVTTQEEVHLIALFDNPEELERLQKKIYDHLPGVNNEELFGSQVVVNEFDEVEGFNQHLLIGATELSIEEVVGEIHRLRGLAIASHIDRSGFGIISHLGFVPPGLKLDALEVSSLMGIEEARWEFAELYRMSFIENSDAHFIHDIGKGFTRIRMEEASVSELRMAFRKRQGRCILE
jgi:3',5'-nucleoside bisphosphate phosphatase